MHTIFPGRNRHVLHDAAAFELTHGSARAQELPLQIDVHHELPSRQRELVERSILLQTRIVDQDIDGAELRDRGLEHALHFGFGGHVGAVRERVGAAASNFVDDLTRLFFARDVVDDHVRAGMPERHGDRLADPGVRPGHQCLLTLQALHDRTEWKVILGCSLLAEIVSHRRLLARATPLCPPGYEFGARNQRSGGASMTG
jgi:hypothetical protein